MENQGTVAAFLVIGILVGSAFGYFLPMLIAPTGYEPTDYLTQIQQRGYMTVGTSSGWPPFEMFNETSGELYGFDIDLVEYIADYLNVTVQWSDMDFGALVGACQTGSIDMIAAATFITPERSEVLAPTQWYIRTNEIVVVKSDSTLEIDELTDLDGYTVGVQTGTVEDEELTELVDEGYDITIERYPRPETMFEDLSSEVLDAVYVDEPVLQVYGEQYNLKSIFVLRAPPTAFYLRRENQSFLRGVNNAIVQGFEDGSIDQLIEKWFG